MPSADVKIILLQVQALRRFVKASPNDRLIVKAYMTCMTFMPQLMLSGSAGYMHRCWE